MYNSDTELIFPLRVTPDLQDLRGTEWAYLVQQITRDGAEPKDQFAFVLMMVRLGGCGTCNADSFRAMRGCTQCAARTIRRYKGDDAELLILHRQCREEVEDYLEQNCG